MSRIKIKRGDSLLWSGTWNKGEDFTANTSLACQMRNGVEVITLTVTVTDIALRAFQVYASAATTATWPEDTTYAADIERTDAGAGPGGDPLVGSTETFAVYVEKDYTNVA